MPKRIKYKKVDPKLVLNFNTPIVECYNSYCPAFHELEQNIGKNPLTLVMEYMNYNEWEDS